MKTVSDASVWRVLIKRYELTEHQEELLKRYAQALKNWDEFGNLTAITHERDIVELHFDDSLVLSNYIDLNQIHTLADIGSGGGCPGIPLAIKFPSVRVYLLEVKRKKLAFLEKLIEELALTNVELVPLDWRTFLRKTTMDIDLFCARASLAVPELTRMFKPTSPYKHAQLVYWASREWLVPKQTALYIRHDWQYHVAGRVRRLIMLEHPVKEKG